MILKAKAKVNLFLDVVSKRPDGYHDLRMISQTVALHDTIDLSPLPFRKGIEFECDDPTLPQGDGNIAYRAAQAFFSHTAVSGGARVLVKKRIPSSAGLGGGSADAAAVLKGLDLLYGTMLDDHELSGIGLGLGADVPYCLIGGTALVEGVGERVTRLPESGPVPLIIVKPAFGVSTAHVYNCLRLVSVSRSERPDIDRAVDIINEGSILEAVGMMKNVLEQVTIAEYPVISDIKALLTSLGACGSVMSGSGPSVFGIFKEYKDAKEAFSRLTETDDMPLGKDTAVYLTETS